MAEGADLSAEQTEKLVYFQEITHIESFDECKQILEAFEWNIESAVQNTFNDNAAQTINNTAESDAAAARRLGAAFSTSSLSSSTSSLASSTATAGTSVSAANAAAAFLDFNQQTNDLFSMSAATRGPPVTPPNIARDGGGANGFNHFGGSMNNHYQRQAQQLPNVSMVPHRTLSYHAARDQAVVPHGFFQWSVFIIAFPFRFLYSTLLDIFSFFYSLVQPSTPIPIDYDPLANIAEYVIYYNQRYGTNHPPFYEGSFAQAHTEAKRDLKFLLIYIHQNDNKDCNTFATETLANKDVIDYISNRVLFWSCSKNLPEGQKVFNAMKAKRCPFLGVIVLKGSRMTLISRIEGPIGSGELILQLENLIMENEAELVTARHEREQRAQDQLLRQQQDQAYLESLRMDQEKQQRKREQEDAKRKADEEERLRQEEERNKANDIVNKKKELRQQLADKPQPDAASPQTIKIGVKFPSGNRYERLFLKSDPVNDLYLFAYSNEECPARFEIATNFPRKVIECDETTTTSFEESGLKQSMLLFVCDLDA